MALQQQFSAYWNKQTRSQRVTLLVLIAAAAILVPVLVVWANTPTYAVAFSGLSEADAGEIIQSLDESGIPYQLKSSGTIMVPSKQVYEARLKMAREGLPQSSTVGYELFSGNTLGMTDFTQRINYQRALEGELERTIGSLSAVESVRVHVVRPEKSLLSEQQDPTTASVTIQQGSSILDSAQVQAITHLVASSVEGLKPENVVVVDTSGKLLADGSQDGAESLASTNGSQRASEAAMAAEIRSRVQTMLDKILGPNRAVVQASVQMDWTQREITSSTFEPTASAVRSQSKVTETYNGDGAAAAAGSPGVDSNITNPGAEESAAEEAQSDYLRSEETVNYEVSQVETVELIAPGQVKNLSVSVMVDGITDPAQLDTIRSAAAAAAGIDTARGDTMVVETMAFDRSYYEAQAADITEQQKTGDYMKYGSAGAAVIAVLALFFYFQRSLRRIRSQSLEAWRPVLRTVGDVAISSGMGTLPALGNYQPASLPVSPIHEPVRELPARQTVSIEDEQRLRVLNRLTEENPATVAEIIQIWLSEDERKNG